MFRSLLLAVALLALPTALTGCPPPVVPTSAITVAETVAETASTVVADAQAVWPIIYASLPAASQASAQSTFNQALFAANHSILALDDAIQAAIATNAPTPDFTAVISQLSGAVAQVVAIVQNFEAAATPATLAQIRVAGGSDPAADMATAVAGLKKLTPPPAKP